MKNADGIKITLDDESFYEVQIARPVQVRGRTLSPMAKNTLKGIILKTLHQEDIADVRLVS